MLRGELGADVDVAGHDLGVAGLEQDVVEGDALIGDAVLHREKLRSGPDREIETTPRRRDARSDDRQTDRRDGRNQVGPAVSDRGR